MKVILPSWLFLNYVKGVIIMHMADALLSPGVALSFTGISAVLLVKNCRKIKAELSEEKIPLMGIMGAFIFAAQMINFTIPGTGSSGHLGGGLLLAALLGKEAAFIVMSSILIIQALFFADGGLLALGCNIFNLGFFPCYIAYPYIYKQFTQKSYERRNLNIASILGAIIALQMGAFMVVLQTMLSGKTQLPFMNFVTLMLPIHLAIGLVEGLVTAAVLNYIYQVRPNILVLNLVVEKQFSMKKVIMIIGLSSILVAGGFSLMASEYPDGLEWSIDKITSGQELETQGEIYAKLAALQEKFSFLPDYNFTEPQTVGTSVAGLVGASITFIVLLFTGKLFRLNKDN